MKDQIFRAYDIRGVIGESWNVEDGKLIAKAYATLAKKHFKRDEITYLFLNFIISIFPKLRKK